MNSPWSAAQSPCPGSGIRRPGRISWLNAGGCLACNCVAHVHTENLISAFGQAVLANVFPLFFVSFLLTPGPGCAGGEVERAGVWRPGEGMNLFIALGHRNGFTAVKRDHIKLRNPIVGGCLFTRLSSFGLA